MTKIALSIKTNEIKHHQFSTRHEVFSIFLFFFQRNGHWMGDSHMGNNEGYNASDSSQRGSQAALLSVNNERHRWPKGKDFLFSTWAFVVGKI